MRSVHAALLRLTENMFPSATAADRGSAGNTMTGRQRKINEALTAAYTAAELFNYMTGFTSRCAGRSGSSRACSGACARLCAYRRKQAPDRIGKQAKVNRIAKIVSYIELVVLTSGLETAIIACVNENGREYMPVLFQENTMDARFSFTYYAYVYFTGFFGRGNL